MMQHKHLSEIRLIPPTYFLLGLIPGIVLQFIFPFQLLPNPINFISGLAMICIAFALALWTGVTLKQAGTHIHIRHPTLTLVTHGPYRFSRNPMYLSLLLLIIGISLLFNFIWFLLCIPLIVFLVNVFVIQHEECNLEKLFGQAYTQYQCKARRWV